MRFLRKYSHLTALGVAKKLRQAGYFRSAEAVKIKTTRLAIKADANGHYTLRQLALAFGIDWHGVGRWIEKGWLRGKRIPSERTERQGGAAWCFTNGSVRQFVLAHPEEVDLCKVDKIWLLELVAHQHAGPKKIRLE